MIGGTDRSRPAGAASDLNDDSAKVAPTTDEVDERIAEQVQAATRRRKRMADIRAAMAERRKYGLRARHEAKLRRGRR